MLIVLCRDISLILQTREIYLHKTIHMISTGDPPLTCSYYNTNELNNRQNTEVIDNGYNRQYRLILLSSNNFYFICYYGVITDIGEGQTIGTDGQLEMTGISG